MMICLHLTHYNVELSFAPSTHKFTLQVRLSVLQRQAQLTIREQLKYNACSQAYYELICRGISSPTSSGIEGGRKCENSKLGCMNKPPRG